MLEIECDWCHEPRHACYCGAVYTDDTNPEDMMTGFHLEEVYEEMTDDA